MHRKVVAALRADPKVRVELVVPVVRAAARARVRVRPASVLWRRVFVLDGDVDPFRHGESVRLGQRPRAAHSRVRGSTLETSAASPLRPAPRTGASLGMRRKSFSVSETVSPPGSGMNGLISPG